MTYNEMEKKNPKLTWDQVVQMKGRPFWLETSSATWGGNGHRWVVLEDVKRCGPEGKADGTSCLYFTDGKKITREELDSGLCDLYQYEWLYCGMERTLSRYYL